jgi:hypothetical protein
MELGLTIELEYEDFGHYLIKVREALGPEWSDWFDGFSMSTDDSGTTLSGPVIDQGALYGLISKMRDLGLTLVSVVREEPYGAQ